MLITTTQELMDFVPVSADLDFQSIKPSIRSAERRYLLPLLGADFYNELVQDYDDATLDDDKIRLVSYCNAVTGPLALWYYAQHGGVNVDNTGIYKTKNDTRWNLSDAEANKQEAYYLTTGLDAMEDLLDFLDENLADYPTYADAPARRFERRTLVPSAQIVQSVFVLIHPSTTFRALRESMRYIEANRLAPVMQDFYAYLLDTPEADLTEPDRTLRDTARSALIYLATARAMITRTVLFTPAGLEVMMGERTPITEPENARIEAAARKYEQSGEHQLSKLRAALVATPPTGYLIAVPAAIVPRRKNADDSNILYI